MKDKNSLNGVVKSKYKDPTSFCQVSSVLRCFCVEVSSHDANAVCSPVIPQGGQGGRGGLRSTE